jgi:sugar phosphate isomerase/epimerase
MSDLPVALQTYTVRDLMASDSPGTIRQVAALGYPAIEGPWPLLMPRQELKALLQELNMPMMGAHVGLNNLEQDLPAVLDDILALGSHYVICPYLDEARRQDADGWRHSADLFNRIGEQVQAAGLQFCYHNHAFEFVDIDGEPALKRLYEWTDPKLVQAELDVYWVKYAGADPVEYIHWLAGRLPLVHLKDMDPSDRSFAEVGEGTIDMSAVMREAKRAGTEWFVVEQDRCKRPSLESAGMSWDNIKKLYPR